MAKRRMFSMDVIDTDAFLEMPITARLLYYELGMRADDDGFVGSPKRIMRNTGCSEDDLRILASRGYIIPFQSGVVVITHWKMNNYIQKDRYQKTIYTNEKAMLIENEKLPVYALDTKCIQNVSGVYTQDSIDKEREVKGRLGNNNTPSKPRHDFSEEFERVWNRYPKKQGKSDALKAFNKARNEGISLETIEEGLDHYLFYISKKITDTKYIKNGSTWFNQHCWEDDYTVVEHEGSDSRGMTRGQQAAKDLHDNLDLIAEWVREGSNE